MTLNAGISYSLEKGKKSRRTRGRRCPSPRTDTQLVPCPCWNWNAPPPPHDPIDKVLMNEGLQESVVAHGNLVKNKTNQRGKLKRAVEKLLLTLQTYSLHTPSVMALIQTSLGKQTTSLLRLSLSSLLCQWGKHSCVYQRPVPPPGLPRSNPPTPYPLKTTPLPLLSLFPHQPQTLLLSRSIPINTQTCSSISHHTKPKNLPTNQKTLMPEHLLPASIPFFLFPLWKNFSKE